MRLSLRRAPLLVLLLAGLSVAGCGAKVRPCKSGTLLVDVSFAANSPAAADTLEVVVVVDGKTLRGTVPHTAGEKSGTIEVSFDSYPMGKEVSVTVTGINQGTRLGTATTTLTLSDACGRVSLTLSTTGGDDGGSGADLTAIPDATVPADLTGVVTDGTVLPDASAPPDARVLPDATALPDFAPIQDLRLSDLVVVPDQVPPQDFKLPQDLVVVSDLSVVADLKPPLDLTPPSDLTPPLDLTPPPIPWWTLRSSPTTAWLNGIWGTGTGDIWAVGELGTIIHSSDGGNTWATQPTGTSGFLTSVWGSSPTDVYAVGQNGTILHTTNGGNSWNPSSFGTGFWRSVWGPDANTVYVVGDNGAIRRTTNGGNTWPMQGSTTSSQLGGIHGLNNADIHACAFDGSLQKFDGVLWMPRSTPTSNVLNAVWRVSQQSLFIVGGGGTILHSSDGGGSFVVQATGTTLNFNGVWSGGGDHYAVGNNGIALRSQFAGNNWTPVPLPNGATPYLQGVWGTGANDVFTVGQGGAIYHHP